MEPMKKIEKALTALVMDEPFFASLALRFKIVKDESIPTFATDGKNLFFNPAFAEKLKIDEIKTVQCHEVLHCALNHLTRMPLGADFPLWNQACDEEVNWTIEEMNEKAKGRGEAEPFPFPGKKDICLSPEFRGVCAEKVYEILKKRKDENKNPGEKQKQDFGSFIPQDDKAEAQHMEEEWIRAVIQAVAVSEGKKMGNIPAEIKRKIEELKNPKIDWRKTLRDFLRDLSADDWNFSKRNRRYIESDFFLPSLHSEKAGNVVFAVDTSGSVSAEMLKDFLSEAQGCLDELSPNRLTVVYCDAEINGIDEYEPGDKITGEAKGGGGTDFRPVFVEMEKREKPDILIYLTDLYGTFPETEPDFPVIWVTETPNENGAFGNTIHV